MKNNSLSILLITCKEYSIFADLCYYFIRENILKYYNCDVYYSNNGDELNSDVKNIITKDIDSKNFILRLYESLKKIDSEYIFLLQEDHWYMNKWLDKENMETILKLMEEKNLVQMKLHPNAYYMGPRFDNDDIYSDENITVAWAGGLDYTVSHQTSIFNKNYLLKNLDECIKNNKTSAWHHEIYNLKYRGTIKNKNDDKKDLRIAYIKNINYRGKYKSVVGRGKICPKAYEELKKLDHIDEVKKLLEILPSTTFLKKQ